MSDMTTGEILIRQALHFSDITALTPGERESAARIDAAIDAAVRQHNEACAKVADDEWDSSCPVGHELESPVAAAIRSLLPTKAGQEDKPVDHL